METWGELRRALSYGIAWERTRLKTNACAPPNDPIIERGKQHVLQCGVEACFLARALTTLRDNRKL